MKLHELRSPEGASRERKRVGRGNGSGHGTYSGRGIKGQKARTGPHIHLYFEGGQLPLSRRLPQKRGFVNIFRTEYTLVNLNSLSGWPAEREVTPQTLAEAGIIGSPKDIVKILGTGEVTAPLIVKVHKVSASAKSKIEAAGGRVELLSAG
jgi:large subunit ribosomal protein L15